ncbi:hypothetical protein JAAARDRAFT_30065 [Jaapia argillacea MUCL 33604]|uniref:RTA1 like protein n=1 Tax=Jaapia argillacea MUCL 33604 TaxID=933084 RepID=A0A067QHS1_9AGAM|nr:hypothetical protein JAAARDRAFT_30065 [Jaapia argillacea MUCL 33604]
MDGYNHALVASALSGAVRTNSSSPFGDTTMLQDILHYSPNKPVAAVAGIIYLVISAALFVRLFKTRDWWGLCLPIGAMASGIGFFVRILLVSNPNSIGIYIGMQILIVCSPAAFLAFNYIVYGRFILNCVGRQYSLIRPEIVAKLFVISDITTFLVQSGGGSLETSKNTNVQKTGSNIFLAGLIAQAASYVLFMVLLFHAHRKIVGSGEYSKNEIWWTAVYSVYFSSVFIVVGCIYRVIELAQGRGGYLLTHEIYFYLLDSVPLIIAISVYVPWWPGNYIKPKTSRPEYSMTSLTPEPQHLGGEAYSESRSTLQLKTV